MILASSDGFDASPVDFDGLRDQRQLGVADAELTGAVAAPAAQKPGGVQCASVVAANVTITSVSSVRDRLLIFAGPTVITSVSAKASLLCT